MIINSEFDRELNHDAERHSRAQSLRMTKREEFAKAIMQGQIARYGLDTIMYKENARRAVAQADALIEALKETP